MLLGLYGPRGGRRDMIFGLMGDMMGILRRFWTQVQYLEIQQVSPDDIRYERTGIWIRNFEDAVCRLQLTGIAVDSRTWPSPKFIY